MGVNGWDAMASHFLDMLLCSRLLGALICSVHYLPLCPQHYFHLLIDKGRSRNVQSAVCGEKPGRIELLLLMTRKLAMW